MQEKIHPTPVWLENDADFKDIRIDLYVDPTDDSGEQDLTVRFSFPKDGAAPYMMLVLGGADLGEIVLSPHYAAQVEARLDKARALFQPYFDGERAFPADLEKALEAGVARTQDFLDANAKLRALPRDADSVTRIEALFPFGEAIKTLEDWAVASADLLPDEPELGTLPLDAPVLDAASGGVHGFEARGDVTHIFREDDDDQTPVLIVPFAGESEQEVEAHMALVKDLIGALDRRAALMPFVTVS